MTARALKHATMKATKKKLLIGLAIGTALLSPITAFAYTECDGTITKMYAGDNGVYVFLSSGAAGFMPSSDVNMKYVFAFTSMALATNRQVTIRYPANGLACNSATPLTQPMMGLWIR